ncbi:histone acetyltransferase HPA2 [Pseudomonas mendocina]|nr:histone acetyltransferase HPA2 [Pseudomonas mendocina]MDV5861648.1 histone acetyltransferase HPA2 [Pseudomonas mendocina]
MNEKDAPVELIDTPAALELTAIEFESPGRFAVHNPQSVTPDVAQWEPAPFILGQHQDLQRFSQPQEARAHVLALIQQAQRSLCLYSDDLEPWLYHHSSVQQACTRFLLSSPRARLRILLRDPTRAVKEGHRLLSLSRRLSSNLHIRKLNPDHANEESAFLIADDRGLFLRPELDQQSGYTLYNDPARVRQRQAQFDQAWDTSITDPDLRSFLL